MDVPMYMAYALKAHTVSEIARGLGVSRQAVYAWKTGKAKVDPLLLAQFEKVTGVPRELVRPDIFVRQEVSLPKD